MSDGPSILQEAHEAVQQRREVYGSPEPNFKRTAIMWSAIFGQVVTPEQVALAMMAVKVARLIETPHHRDSIVDIAGYAECLAGLQVPSYQPTDGGDDGADG